MRELPDFKLETFFSRWEFTARHHLCASDLESMTVGALLELADDADRQRWDELRLGYIETFGTPELRAAIAATFVERTSADILVFAGAEEGIFTAMQVLLSADDHAIVVTPNYQSAETLPGGICEVTAVALDEAGDWDLDVDRVRDALRPNTRLISINFPHNPTGKIISHDRLEALIAIARERDLWIFSDEVYRLIERDPAMRLPQVADVYEKGLSLNVMSKSYGLPGLRVGWIASSDRELLGKMERVKHYLSICNSAPSEVLATIALKARDHILERNRGIVDENLRKLDRFFAEFPDLFEWSVPDGGCVGFPRYLGSDGVERFCERLVNDAGVLLLPANIYESAYGPTPADRFRIGYGRLGLEEGLDAMRSCLDRQAA